LNKSFWFGKKKKRERNRTGKTLSNREEKTFSYSDFSTPHILLNGGLPDTTYYAFISIPLMDNHYICNSMITFERCHEDCMNTSRHAKMTFMHLVGEVPGGI
jgi:hypothetical protein